MACFTVSAVEAVAVHVIEKREAKRELKAQENHEVGIETTGEAFAETTNEVKSIPLSRKLKWLKFLLLGGSVLLMFEHIWHGEIVPWFPFLSAMENATDMAAMFNEMATVGVGMAVLITAVWGVMCKVADIVVSRPDAEVSKKNVA
ncbi:MAG: hypothetical protein K6G11_09200 [Lachnospiraceae bacterium]|nr:hypothetical protein [Lachnospiraceae bacterium]